jgi:hypothetical protein
MPIALFEVYSTSEMFNETNGFGAPSGIIPGFQAINRKVNMNAINLSKVLTLILALCLGNSSGVKAEENPGKSTNSISKAESKKPVPQQLSGKVVAVDKYGKSITLQVNNVSYVLQVADATRFTLGKREKSIADVVVGEQINVTMLLRELADGRVEIAVLAVELGVAAEAQGKGRGRGRGKSKETQAPFHTRPSTPPTNSVPAVPTQP